MEQPKFPDHPSPHQAFLRTRWVDEDSQGLLNNAIYLTLMEEARYAFFSERGVMRSADFPFVLSQVNVRYLKPGRGASDVLVETCTTHVGNSSFIQNYRTSHRDSGEIWCEAEALLVCVDAQGSSCPMSAEFRAVLQD